MSEATQVRWIVTMKDGVDELVLGVAPVMLANAALATEHHVHAPGTWRCVFKEDGSAFTPADVRALQGLPQPPAPWVEAPPPDMVHERPDAPPAMAGTPDLDPPA